MTSLKNKNIVPEDYVYIGEVNRTPKDKFVLSFEPYLIQTEDLEERLWMVLRHSYRPEHVVSLVYSIGV